MTIRLSCTDAVSTIDDVTLDSLPTTVGRGEEADVSVHDSWASRIHCQLVEQDGELWVEDNNSSNGTSLNGSTVLRNQVQSGDELTVGITTFRVIFSRLPAAAQRIESEQLVGS
ncbi:MAG: FHA domain-containing protein [Planctomycetes bacterium]|nr:FHA domain-containing protein [Planctomycetota bacterium]